MDTIESAVPQGKPCELPLPARSTPVQSDAANEAFGSAEVVAATTDWRADETAWPEAEQAVETEPAATRSVVTERVSPTPPSSWGQEPTTQLFERAFDPTTPFAANQFLCRLPNVP